MMLKYITSIKYIALALAITLVLIYAVPGISKPLVRFLLLPFEKKFEYDIEFERARIIMPIRLALSGVSVKDPGDRLYSCRSADLRYVPIQFLYTGKRTIFAYLTDVQLLRNSGLIDSVASILSIDDIDEVEFSSVEATFHFKDGSFYIEDLHALGDLLRIKGDGHIDRDGTIDCDITFFFARELTGKIPEVLRKSLLAEDDQGWSSISFEAYGHYEHPSLRISGQKLRLNIIESIISEF